MVQCRVESHNGIRGSTSYVKSNKGWCLHHKEAGIQVRWTEEGSLTPPFHVQSIDEAAPF